MTRGGADGSTLQAGQRVVVQVLRERAAERHWWPQRDAIEPVEFNCVILLLTD
jgi:hypothetical protein